MRCIVCLVEEGFGIHLNYIIGAINYRGLCNSCDEKTKIVSKHTTVASEFWLL